MGSSSEVMKRHIHVRNGKFSYIREKTAGSLLLFYIFYISVVFRIAATYHIAFQTRTNSSPQGAVTSLPSAKTIRYACNIWE